jgi:hypothetical protein
LDKEDDLNVRSDARGYLFDKTFPGAGKNSASLSIEL